jgi:predicted DNA-binding transcriptional regulator AlpA
MTFPSDRLITVKDVSDYMQVTPAAVYKWIKDDKMPSPLRLGQGSRPTLRWSPQVINTWLEENTS